MGILSVQEILFFLSMMGLTWISGYLSMLCIDQTYRYFFDPEHEPSHLSYLLGSFVVAISVGITAITGEIYL